MAERGSRPPRVLGGGKKIVLGMLELGNLFRLRGAEFLSGLKELLEQAQNTEEEMRVQRGAGFYQGKADTLLRKLCEELLDSGIIFSTFESAPGWSPPPKQQILKKIEQEAGPPQNGFAVAGQADPAFYFDLTDT